MAFSQRDLYQVRREIEKESKKKCAIIYGGLPPGEETLRLKELCPFSSPEAALLLVSTKHRDLWPSPTTFRF